MPEKLAQPAGGADGHVASPDGEAVAWASTGHAAAIVGDELYDVLPPTRGGYGRLQDFGIRCGYERVVLHIEPWVAAGRVRCNTARTLLLLDHEPLPWSRWGEEFAARMPDEIRRLQETGRRRRLPCRAKRRSATASTRSCTSTASAATGDRGRQAGHPQSQLPAARKPSLRTKGPSRLRRPLTSRPCIL